MILFTKDLLCEYRKKDNVLELLHKATDTHDDIFTSHQWLLSSEPKRMIFFSMYGDLLEQTKPQKKIIDVGGGYTALTKLMRSTHDYTLLDIMAHDNKKMKKLTAEFPETFWINNDWYNVELNETYDIVIANDIFPNVDQRLELFLHKFIPLTKELRITLTFYNEPRFYKVKRTDAEEILYMLAWDGHQTMQVLKSIKDRIQEQNFSLFSLPHTSIFPNKRSIIMVTLNGERA